MCNFPIRGKSQQKSGQKSKWKFNRNNKPAEDDDDSTHLFSSPSKMRTTDLTEVYKVPSRHYQSAQDVITAKGFKLGYQIGKGNFGTVRRGVRVRDNLPVACKQLKMRDTALQAIISAKNELYVMEAVNHPHIIKMYEHFIVDLVDLSIRYVFIFMQLAEGDSLSVYIRLVKRGLPELQCKQMMAQMVSALNHMHAQGIAHRDLKMGNVLLDDHQNCLVSDFGLSRVAAKGENMTSTKFCGTMAYMAPEVILNSESSIEYNPFTADIWALGVILYAIVNHGYPFGARGSNIFEQQMKHRIKLSYKITFEPDQCLMDLLYRLLDPNVQRRISISDLMTHRWIAPELRRIENALQGTGDKLMNCGNFAL